MQTSSTNKLSGTGSIFYKGAQCKHKGSISPGFGIAMVLLMFFGTYSIASISESATIFGRLVISTLATLMVYVPGMFLFQKYEMLVTTREVKWYTSIIPGVWSQQWEEPVSNYQGILKRRIKPVNGMLYPKYSPYNAVFPRQKEESKFNSSNFIIIVLKHRNDKKKDLAVTSFRATDINQINEFCEKAEKELNLKPLN
jgi:hypothetical protein